MAAEVRRVTLSIGRTVAIAAGTVVLIGCTFRPVPASAYSARVQDEERVTVNLHASDARTIENRQLYFYVIVGDCNDPTKGFPAEPYIDGQRASEFKFSTADSVVAVESRVPARIFNGYRSPCAFLQGGGYFTGKIKSSAIRILKVQSTGPNNSFEPKPLRGSA